VDGFYHFIVEVNSGLEGGEGGGGDSEIGFIDDVSNSQSIPHHRSKSEALVGWIRYIGSAEQINQ